MKRYVLARKIDGFIGSKFGKDGQIEVVGRSEKKSGGHPRTPLR